MISIQQKTNALLKPDPHAEHWSSPLGYNEVETVSIFHLNKKITLTFEIKRLSSLAGLATSLVRGTLVRLVFQARVYGEKIIILLVSLCALLF